MKSSKPRIKLSDRELEILRNHVRLVRGLDVPQKKIKNIPVKEPQLRMNSAHTFRMECIKKRRHVFNKVVENEAKEHVKIKDHISRRRKSIQFTLNKAFHMRWKKVRRLPVLSSHDRAVFNDTGKLPFVVPAFYKPFHAYTNMDMSNQEFIFLDENEEKKKKEASSTTLQPTLRSSTSSSSISDITPTPQVIPTAATVAI